MAIDGTPNDDSLGGTAGNDTINGLDGDDQLFGYGGQDTLNGGNDDDYLDGGIGADTLNGGAGDDRMLADVGDVSNGGTGVDYLTIDLSSLGTNVIEALDFTAGVMNTLPSNTKFQNVEVLGLTTGSGNDTITYDSSAIYGASVHSHYFYGGGGVDKAIVNWSDQAFSMNGSISGITIGSTSLSLSAVERVEYRGGSGNDNFSGGADNDTFFGNGGNDTLNGQGGNDNMDGGDGNDLFYAGNSSDNAGIDTINGGTGDDTINAAFKDVINGASGRDYLTLDLSDRSTDASLAFDPTTSNTILTTTFQNIEQLYLSTGSGDDSLSFDSSAIQISTTTDGYWYGGSGTDTLTVDFSDQIFNVNANVNNIQIADFLFSLSAIEKFVYESGSGNDSLSGSSLADTLTGNGGRDNLYGGAGIDVANGGVGRDGLYGGSEDDTLNGDDDRDYLQGDDGKDKLNGGDGRDTLYGGLSDDTMKGNAGNDRMQGDGGKDIIDGGTDADTLFYVAVLDSTGKNYDTVQNFDFSAADKFHFNAGCSGFDGTDGNGTLDNATFNDDLEDEIAALGSHHAIFFKPNAGSFAGSTFLIVDSNGVVGYQANEDYVIRLTTPANFGAADLTDFQG